jgi:signal transduction histidine kinase
MILLTGLADEQVDQLAMTAGASDYLVKGEFNETLLDRSIRYAVENKRNQLARQKLEEKLSEAQKMESLGILSAGVAHEINNPISFVRSNINSLNRYIKLIKELVQQYQDVVNKQQNLSPEAFSEQLQAVQEFINDNRIPQKVETAQEIIGESLEGVDRVIDIVKQLRLFTRDDEETKHLLNINTLLESTIQLIENHIADRCRIQTEMGKIPETYCLPGPLNQVFTNMIINAYQAIPEKGTLLIKTEASEDTISIQFRRHGKRL